MESNASLPPMLYSGCNVEMVIPPNSTKQARSKTPSIQRSTAPKTSHHRNQYHPNRTAFHVSTCTIHIKPPSPKPQITPPPLLRLCLDLHLSPSPRPSQIPYPTQKPISPTPKSFKPSPSTAPSAPPPPPP